MSQVVEFSPNRTISANGLRDGQEVALQNHTAYRSTEKISLQLSPATTQMVWQVETSSGCNGKPAYFEDGACEDLSRTLTKKPVLVMPTSEDCVVKVVNGWAISYKSGVKLSAEFVFISSDEEVGEVEL